MKYVYIGLIFFIISFITTIPNIGILEHATSIQKIAFIISIYGLCSMSACFMRSIDLKE